MPISVVIPARNAEGTIGDTLASLRAQTRSDWEALIVDDGSTDGTLTVALQASTEDSRIRVIEAEGAGVGAARNLGLAEARHELLLFLDADDLIRPTFLAQLGAELDLNPRFAAAHCGWARLAPDGSATAELEATETGDLFAEFAFQCLFPIHACLVRTELVRAVGGFDTSLVTCEDWDLWLRIARLGRPFAVVRDVLALYRMRERSASLVGRQMLHDGLEVLGRARRPDPRVAAPAPHLEPGWAQDDLAATRLYHACWTAGLVLGSGADACDLLGPLRQCRSPGLDPEAAAHCIFVSAPLPRCLKPEQWASLWPELAERTACFLADLEKLSGSEHFARRTLRALERHILVVSPAPSPAHLGRMLAREVEATDPIPDVPVPVGVDRVLCRVTFEGVRLGVVELPACDGLVPATELADAMASEFAWPILGRFFASTVYRELRIESGEPAAAYRGDICLSASLPGDSHEQQRVLHDTVGWTVLLQEVFGLPDWPPGRFYDWDDAHLTGDPDGSGTHPVVELSGPLLDLEAAAGFVDVVATIGGIPLGVVRVDGRGVIPAGQLVPALATEAGFELARLVVREGILGRPLGCGRTLRERLAEGARSRAGGLMSVPADELVVCRRRPYEIGGVASRVASLPRETASDVLRCASLAGEAVRAGTFPPRRARYQPDELEAPAEAPAASNGSASDRDYFDSLFEERIDPWDYTNPYEVTKYEQTLQFVPRRVRRALELGCAEGHFTATLSGRVEKLLAADISDVALGRARERCAGLSNIDFIRLDVAGDALPTDLDLIVCSELLYYLDSRSELDRVAGKLSRSLRPGGTLVTAHAHIVADDPANPGFVWDVPFGAKTIGAALREAGGLELQLELRTPFYRIQRFRRPRVSTRLRRRRPVLSAVPQPQPLPPQVAATARWEGAAGPGNEAKTSQLPILMYHRIASSGAAPLARYRLAPEQLEAQLAYFRDEGFRSVGFEEFGRALRARRALPGRALMLTFDDGCRDFLTEAWPLLRAYGFGATIFVVADRVGGTNEWDSAYGDEVDLLGWDDLRRLVRAGVEIGSHTATHPHLTDLSLPDVVREAARSRTTILRELGVEPSAIAYPYGDVDATVGKLVGAVGYAYGVTAEARRARLVDDPLRLPRIEVTGSFSPAALETALGLSDRAD